MDEPPPHSPRLLDVPQAQMLKMNCGVGGLGPAGPESPQSPRRRLGSRDPSHGCRNPRPCAVAVDRPLCIGCTAAAAGVPRWRPDGEASKGRGGSCAGLTASECWASSPGCCAWCWASAGVPSCSGIEEESWSGVLMAAVETSGAILLVPSGGPSDGEK